VQPGATLKSRTLAWNYVDRSRFATLVKQTVAAGVWNCPTIVVGYQFMLPAAEHEQLMRRPEAGLLRPEGAPARSTISWLADFSEVDFAEAQRAVGPQLEFVAALAAGGARLLVGTDSWLQGFAFQDELELFERAGIARPEILRLATRAAAEFLGRADTQGAVAVGQVADLQLVGGDPIRARSKLRDRRGGMARGRFYGRAELDRMLRP
jgi:imidazolonepropionase-like amidohydrolase